ncbi:unnamed protein product [Owenia fusiformis]|uniref:Uncharacterized protein n=1 Tax=Owenia fusiformis TaxID=6347 RepID=A0A8J1TWH2_OWEFU|nr:unnamed protein product [Owenia fusiformis]
MKPGVLGLILCLLLLNEKPVNGQSGGEYVNCAFDDDATNCALGQIETAGTLEFTRLTGPSPQSSMTGPSSDASGSGGYMWVESSGMAGGDYGEIIIPNQSGMRALSVKYSMYGAGMGKLEVIQRLNYDTTPEDIETILIHEGEKRRAAGAGWGEPFVHIFQPTSGDGTYAMVIRFTITTNDPALIWLNDFAADEILVGDPVLTGGARSDFVFALDVSDSVGEQGFVDMKNLIKSSITDIAIGNEANASSVAVLTYSANGANIAFDFDDYSTKEDITAAVDALEYNPGNEINRAGDLYVGLEAVRDQLGGGAGGNRADAPDVVFLLQDGAPKGHKGEEAAMAQSLKDQGWDIHMAGIGGDDAHMRELEILSKQVVSDPDNIMIYDNSSKLSELSSTVSLMVENDRNECGLSPCRNGGTCNDLVDGYRCICPSTRYGTVCEYDASSVTGETLDLTYMLDFSRFDAINSHITNFLKQLESVKAAAEQYNAQGADVNFSIMKYGTAIGTGAEMVMDSIPVSDMTAFNLKLSEIINSLNSYPGNSAGATNFAPALELLASRPGRDGAKQTAILIADSPPRDLDAALDKMVDVEGQGIKLITVGVGSSFEENSENANNLKKFAQNNAMANANYKHMNSYTSSSMTSDFTNFVLSRSVVSNTYCDTNPCQNGATCSPLSDFYECSCTEGYGGVNCDNLCQKRYDIVFALDESGSVENKYGGGFALEQMFMTNVVSKLPFFPGTYYTQVGLVKHGGLTKVTTVFDLARYQTSVVDASAGGSIRRAVNAHVMRTSDSKARQRSFLSPTLDTINTIFQNGGRADATPVAVLIMDDPDFESGVNITVEAEKLKSNGITIYTIGIGPSYASVTEEYEKELGEIASSPDHIIQVTDMSELPDIAEQLLSKICLDQSTTVAP